MQICIDTNILCILYRLLDSRNLYKRITLCTCYPLYHCISCVVLLTSDFADVYVIWDIYFIWVRSAYRKTVLPAGGVLEKPSVLNIRRCWTVTSEEMELVLVWLTRWVKCRADCVWIATNCAQLEQIFLDLTAWSCFIAVDVIVLCV